MQQPSVCYCSSSEEARNISKFGDPHVHCPCDKCKGKATWRMTAWRHLQAKNYYNSEPSSKIQRLDNPNEPDLESSQDFDSIDSCTNDDRNSLASDNFVSDTSEHDVDEQIFTDQELMKEFVQDAVLRLLEMKEKMHCSEKHVVELLEWGKMLHTSGNNKEAEQYWPKNWNDVQVLLKTIGFVEPKLYWICLRSDHPNHYGLMESQDEFCPYCGQTGHIPYYYMSLIERVKTWCSNKEMCHKMTTHWRNKEHWLPDEMKEGWGWHSKSELWDGCRFAELSYFWNPNRGWYLPARCAFEGCENIISAEVMIQSPVKNDGVTRVVTCQECGSSFNHIPVEVRGDPRNIAYTGHWDGWQPFSSPFRGCGAIEVSIATMGKLDRCHKDQVYVIGFVPSYLIPNKRSDALDPFLEPLIKDLERGFIDGINVDYKIPIDDIAVGNTVIRHLLLCWKGDHNGQCESGKFIKCGKKACRRCHLEAVWIADSNHYYYPEFRKQGRYPNQEKSILDNMNIIQDIDQEERRSVKAAKAKDSGYTGLSILHRLYPLYGFLYDQDLVFDEMHILPLNIVKHHIQLFLDDEDGIFSDINWKEVDERLERFPWTAEQRAGRIPKCISKRFNYWKAEELSQFIFPAAEICFSGMLDSSHYDILVCLCRIVEYVVNHSRNGWTEEEANTFYEMCLRYGILVEETYGVKRCVITLHSILHLYKDIQRFGSLDNYSCWTEERAVHHYIKKSNNHKNIELTFALSELRQEILKFRKTAQVITQSTTSKFDSEKAWAHSLASAKVLIVKNGEEKFHDGVIVGGHQWCAIDLQDRQMISAVKGVAIKDVAQIGSTARSLWKPNSSFGGLLYRAGDYAMFAHPEVGDTVIELRKFVSLKVKGCALVCAHAEEYTYCGYTESGMMQVQPTQNTILIEAALISRKIMLTQMLTEDDDEEVKFTLIDYMRRLFPESKELEDEVFFDFISERAKKKELPLPPIPEGKGVGAEEEPEEREPEKDQEKEPLTPRDEVDRAPEWLGPPGPQANVRGKRMTSRPAAVNADRRQYGKGLVGRWLNRTIKRKRLSSTVRKQLEHLSDHRPYFTYWVSFVQVVILIVTLSVYHFAPIGFTKTERSKLVRKSRQGTLVPEFLIEYDQDNFWIGPNQESLIHLGAKFAPCMRNDKLLVEALERERIEESMTGCCIKTDNSGCMQSSRKECSRAFTNFIEHSNHNKSRAVCGQDPQLCQDPPSVKPYEWSNDITEWPICKKTRKKVSSADFPHMTCEVTARPCCIKTQARCQILSRDECDFKKGYFHENATLCSQVDCLGKICGMIPFLKAKVADQIYRLWMAIFLHAGLIHLACTLVFNFTILRDLEKLCGWIRIGIIYVFSGIGGYLVSAILIPYQVEVGPSGSMFGIIACLFVELIQSWQIINRPIIALMKLVGVVFLLLIVGLLPYVDNFAHMSGFVFGFLLAFIFLPYITFGEWDKRRKIIQLLVAFAILIIFFVVAFVIFLGPQTATCKGCEYLNCVPFTVDFCEPYNLGHKLQPR